MKKTTRGAAILAGAMTACLMGVPAASPATAAPAPVAAQTAAPAGSTATVTFVLRAWWETTTRGPRLRVEPSQYGRTHAFYEPGRAWDQALDKAGRKPLSSAQWTSLYNQFRCHAKMAQDKPTWNMESWRSNVGYQATLAAACNPT